MIPFIKYLSGRKNNFLLDEHSNNNKTYYQNIFTHTQDCRQHIFDGIPCNDRCSFHSHSTLVHFIQSAKESICICTLTLQLRDVLNHLIKAHEEGLVIRLILDREMIVMDSQKLNNLNKAGIPIKTQKADGSYLHHKFCLIDHDNEELSKMFFGSMNITMQGMVKNFEHITLTNDKDIIHRFSEEFEELWNEFDLFSVKSIT
ncbi:hypothetical protein WA026_020166 [Henosepilachna vigintioctopunctata]|uniref:Mitochondrial cardiolipin hydrolase n=1 Tax=Henosepilachna vigintioctopunctata TaxID=420089 RepID=A0AAW1UBD8_9CUCU